jgi:aminopeptidase N
MNYLSLLSVHETAHQWWFGLVANDQAMEPWLDEALATYSEYLFLEEFYPELTSWWWNFRVNSYNPTGSIGSTIYEFDSTRTYINAVYLRGAVFLHELRTLLTDDFFFDRLVRYTKNYTGLISSGEAFKNIFVPDMADSETDLIEEFFDQ